MWHTYISPINMTCSVPNLVWEAVDPFHWIQRPVMWSCGQHLQAWAQQTHPYVHKCTHRCKNVTVRCCSQHSIIIWKFLILFAFCLFLLSLTEGFKEMILRQLSCVSVVIGSVQFKLVTAGQFGLKYSILAVIFCVQSTKHPEEAINSA